MSSVDDDLFAPIDAIIGANEPWRREVHEINAYIREQRKDMTVRPTGALLLEELMEYYHLHQQHSFWLVDPVDGKWEFDFNGTVYKTSYGNVYINDPDDGWNVVEWNLYPNEACSDAYIFARESDAYDYEKKLQDRP